MTKTLEEQYGLLALTNIMSSVWLGDWDRYEAIFNAMNEELKSSFPFHHEYDRENVKLWHENHFSIPGNYFVPPYYSSYKMKNENAEEKRKNLLCLIGTYEKMGFYFPLQQELYPDHIGCMISFMGAIQQEKIKCNESEDGEAVEKLESLEQDVAKNYVWPVISAMNAQAIEKMQHPFFAKFLSFSYEMLKEEYFQ